jgi:hypothetical protein
MLAIGIWFEHGLDVTMEAFGGSSSNHLAPYLEIIGKE